MMRVVALLAAVASASAFSVAPMAGGLSRSSKAMALKPAARTTAAKSQVVMSAGGFVPDMGRRTLMNAFLLGSVAGPLLVLPAVLIAYLTPAKAGGGGGGTVAKDDNTLEDFGVNAVCTHLGCVVPWNKSANKFACPCHGSQYDKNGKVVRGPAPLSLALAKRGEQDGTVVLSPWTETDFRDGQPPWWKP